MTKSEKEELLYITEYFDTRAADLMLYALSLADLLENTKETPREDGGRPLRHLYMVWEDAAELIANVQQSARACADDLMHIRTRLLWYSESPTTPDLEKPKPKTLGDLMKEKENAAPEK